eukprot:CAMPEP_0170563684 /NCGR_PEP_ID=MMETSP0211-20121228/68245_1 /TAXON_ID=311385 /ORGANISM="Pseudokeronopsis sp., Strain OXSARD2" /LENGTH=67 /DNA_ID=CAMNT_0010882221 /DNA_START=88 /DNA_END=288 /DNA_ORIENTATION=-
MIKRQKGVSLKEMEKKWAEEFWKESSGKSIKRISKVLKKCQKTELISARYKNLLESKFQEFVKFSRG